MRRLGDLRNPAIRETPAARAASHVQQARQGLKYLSPDERAYIVELARLLISEAEAQEWQAFGTALESR